MRNDLSFIGMKSITAKIISLFLIWEIGVLLFTQQFTKTDFSREDFTDNDIRNDKGEIVARWRMGSLIIRAKNSADRKKLTKLVEYFLNN